MDRLDYLRHQKQLADLLENVESFSSIDDEGGSSTDVRSPDRARQIVATLIADATSPAANSKE
jgi:hypothetical protein